VRLRQDQDDLLTRALSIIYGSQVRSLFDPCPAGFEYSWRVFLAIGNNLQSNLTSLPAKPGFKTSAILYFVLRADGLIVGMPGYYHVINDEGRFVRRGRDCLRGPESSAHPALESVREYIGCDGPIARPCVALWPLDS
jgi:hypothetical protein